MILRFIFFNEKINPSPLVSLLLFLLFFASILERIVIYFIKQKVNHPPLVLMQ